MPRISAKLVLQLLHADGQGRLADVTAFGGDRYTRLIQEALDAVVILKRGLITYANRSFGDLLGRKSEELIGLEFLQFIDDRDHAPLSALSQDKVHELSIQVDIHTPTGLRVLDGRFHAIKDRPDTVIAFLRDITEDVALEKRLLRQNQDLAVINLISEILSSSLQLKEVLEMTLSKVLQVMNIETGWIFVLDEASQLLKVAYAHGLPAEVVDSISELRLGEGIAGQVALSGEPLIIENASNDPRINAKSIMGVMMLAAGLDAQVVLETSGEQEQEAMQAIADLFADKFGEGE